MHKRLSLVLLGLLLSAGLAPGCRPSNQTATTTPVVPSQPNAPTPQPSETAPPTETAVSQTPIKDAVEKLLAQQTTAKHPVIPPGTKLLHADLTDGVVTLDFSSEFNRLGDMGDTVESEAQKKLRRALSHIRGVEKMRVTVEGKPYDSQMTDWYTPFPVRYDGGFGPPGQAKRPLGESLPESNRGQE